MIYLPKVIINKRARNGKWCKLKYPNHPKGCPNYPKCIKERTNIKTLTGYKWYAVIEKFNLNKHAKKMKKKHPEWTEKQCRNLLYWQGGVRKRLIEKARKGIKCSTDVLLDIPEANGINVFKTMANVGVNLQREKPKQIIKVMLIGKKKDAN